MKTIKFLKAGRTRHSEKKAGAVVTLADAEAARLVAAKTAAYCGPDGKLPDAPPAPEPPTPEPTPDADA